MQGLQEVLIRAKAMEVLRDKEMLVYMAQKALVFLKAEQAEIMTTVRKNNAEVEDYKRRTDVIYEAFEIMRSLDSDQVEDYCGPIGKYVFSAQMDQFCRESEAFVSNVYKRLRGLVISARKVDYPAKEKLLDELEALLKVVLSKLDQLYDDLKMKEHDPLHEHSKEIDENLILSEDEALFAELKFLRREMENITVRKEKAKYELYAQIQVVKSKLGQLCNHDAEEVIAISNDDQLQPLTKETVNDAEEVVSIVEEAFKSDEVDPQYVQASESHGEDINAIIWEKLSAVAVRTELKNLTRELRIWTELKNLNGEVQIANEKLEVYYELQAHMYSVISKVKQEKLKVVESVAIRFEVQFPKDSKVPANSDEEVPEVVRHIKKWESEAVNADTIIGLKKIGDDGKQLWNMKEDKAASLKEAIGYLVMMLRVRSDTDLISHAT